MSHVKNPRKTTEDLTLNFTCCICMEHKNFYCLGACDHICTCLACALKFRTFYKNLNCPVCHEKLERIFVCPISESHSFNDLNSRNLDAFFKDEDFDSNGIFYVEISGKEESLIIKNFKCPIPTCENDLDNLEDIKEHLKSCHELYFCEVCLKESKKFLSEQKVYSKNDLYYHKKFGDIENEIPPHFQCKFCKFEWFYNDEILFNHMKERHFFCEICNKLNHEIIFYSNVQNLKKHNEFKHFCCPFIECKEGIFIVFGKENEFKNHLINQHKIETQNIKKIIDENYPKEFSGAKIESNVSQDQFNFTQYVSQIIENYDKNRCEFFKKINDKNQKNQKFNREHFQNFNMDDVEYFVDKKNSGNNKTELNKN